MRTFAQKPKATQQIMPAKSMIPRRPGLGQNQEVDSILHLQRTIGNQAVQRMLQTHTEEVNVGLTGTPSPRFGHDFSRIPVHCRSQANAGQFQHPESRPLIDKPLLQPQRTAGNQAFQGLLRSEGEGRRRPESTLEHLQLNPDNVAPFIHGSVGKSLPNPYLPPHLGIATHIIGGPVGEIVADAYGAEAVTVGTRIFAPERLAAGVLRHELAHAAQAAQKGPPASRETLEMEARKAAQLTIIPSAALFPFSASSGLPLFHPALRNLLRAGRWLARRSTNTLSKHVARHGRRIAGRAVHSVFRNPRKIKSLVKQAVQDGVRLARSQAARGTDEVLEEGGLRVMQQATGTPGKFRTVVEKNFGRPIGTRGEQILRVVLDYSGRVVTAFPVDRFLAIGLGAVAVELFTANTAEAAERSRAMVEAHENRPTDWGEVAFELAIDVLSFGLLASSPVNEGEDLMLALDRIVDQATQDTIREIEAGEGIALTTEQKQAIRELVEVAVGAPMEFEAIEEEAASSSPRRYIRSPDGSILDTQTGRVTLGPGPKI